MKKILPIGNAMINGRLHYGYPLSILAGTTDYLPWLYSNFIQLYSMKYEDIDERQDKNSDFYRFTQVDFDFYTPHIIHNHWMLNNPFFESECLNRNSLQGFKLEIIDLLIELIDQDKYIYMFVDEFYLNKKSHYMHNIMIHGYDLENKCFYSSGYINDEYETYTIGFEDLHQSFYPEMDYFPFPYDMLYILKIKKDFSYSFSLSQTYRLLSDFISSTNTGANYSLVHYEHQFKNVSYTYGIHTYDTLLELITSLSNHSAELDISLFHTLKEHKHVMFSRLRYMEEHFIIPPIYSDNYLEIKQNSDVLKTLLLKYNFSKSNNVLVKASDRLKYIREKELLLFEQLINEAAPMAKAF